MLYRCVNKFLSILRQCELEICDVTTIVYIICRWQSSPYRLGSLSKALVRPRTIATCTGYN